MCGKSIAGNICINLKKNVMFKSTEVQTSVHTKIIAKNILL